MMILPVAELAIVPVTPALAKMPRAPSELVIWIVPSLATLLLLSIVTAVPLVGLIEPAEPILISSAAPDLTVEVLTGVVVAVVMLVSAYAGMAMIVARQVDASRVLRMEFLF